MVQSYVLSVLNSTYCMCGYNTKFRCPVKFKLDPGCMQKYQPEITKGRGESVLVNFQTT